MRTVRENRIYMKAYYRKHRKRLLSLNKKYRQANRKKFADYHRQWSKLNKEHLRKYHRAWHAKRPNRQRMYHRKWYKINRLDILARGKEKNRQKRTALILQMGAKCVRCGFCDQRALQIDHIIPCGGGIRRMYEAELASPLVSALLQGKRDILKYQLLCANCNVIKMRENNEWITGRRKTT